MTTNFKKTYEEVKNRPNTLIKFLRDKNGFKKGVLIAIDSGVVGWSLCHRYGKDFFKGIEIPLPLDEFNKEKGVSIAYGRAEKYRKMLDVANCNLLNEEAAIRSLSSLYAQDVPSSIQDEFDEMFNRSIRYFKK